MSKNMTLNALVADRGALVSFDLKTFALSLWRAIPYLCPRILFLYLHPPLLVFALPFPVIYNASDKIIRKPAHL